MVILLTVFFQARLRIQSCRRFLFSVFLLFCLTLCVSVSDAKQVPEDPHEDQLSLTEELMEEGFDSLAKAARQNGNAVQGSIYFAQKQLRCAECHARGNAPKTEASDGSRWLGPNLAMLAEKRTDAAVVESLLNPSAVIESEYQTTLVLLDDGRQVTGRMVPEDNGDLLLQSLDPPYSVTRIDLDEIVQQSPSQQSAMPSGLMDSLQDRQAFLDLVSYLYQLVGSAVSVEPIESVATEIAVVQKERVRGLVLMDEFRCVRCHQRDESNQPELPSHVNPVAPDLEGVTSRASAEYLRQFIADPHSVKPGTVMPNMMLGMDQGDRLKVAGLIVDFLGSLSPATFESQPLDSDSKTRGDNLYHTVGCVACHLPRGERKKAVSATIQNHLRAATDENGEDVSSERFYSLGDLARKYSRDSLTRLLEDPLAIRPSGRMPNLGLTHWEAEDIATYLLSVPDDELLRQSSSSSNAIDLSGERKETGQTAALRADDFIPTVNEEQRVAEGRQWFSDLNCIECHELEGMEAKEQFTSLGKLNADRGCLALDPSRRSLLPHYELSSIDRSAIAAALEDHGKVLSPAENLHWTLESLRCTSCHDRGGVGGVQESLDSFFTTTNQNLGPQGRIPPTLTSVGSKLRPKWLRQVLVSGRSIRPYMLTRMPQFGEQNVDSLLNVFHAIDQPLKDGLVELPNTKEVRDSMTEMIGRSGLNCIACHTFQNKGADTMPALDLTEMAERLQPGWFYQYMLSPQSIRPNTVMPSFWPGGNAIRKDLMDGTTSAQLTGIWNYLERGRQAPTPRGLKLEPIELLAGADEAVMLRRSYPNIGKRGIGVGYPLGINLAFDAEQMRLALMWRGGFADPGGVWRGQGHGRVRPLSSDIWTLGVGPDLDSELQPWRVDDGRPPHHQFTGYYLDEKQRPTFTYLYQGVEVEDYFVDGLVTSHQSNEQTTEATSPVVLHREFRLRSNKKVTGLSLRLATGKVIEAIERNEFSIDQRVKVKTPSDAKTVVVSQDKLMSLHLRFDAPEGETKMEIQYVW